MKRTSSSPGQQEQGAGVTAAAGGNARACLTIDAARGLIVEANVAGWQAWGFDAAPSELPVAVDRAMPAMLRLSQIGAGQRGRKAAKGAGSSETLAFWTARGAKRWHCKVTGNGADGLLRVELPGAAEDEDGERMAAAAGRPAGAPQTERLAHELRTPLSAVIAYAEVLKDEHFGPMANERYRDYARNIYDSARHALGVVDGMLGRGSAQSGMPELAFRDLDPAEIVDSCLGVARPLAADAGLELGADVAGCLPRIVADEVSLKQMLLNLLTNAIKFARAGDKVTVRVSYEAGGPLCIAVADTGPGMSQPPLALQGGRSRRGRLVPGLRDAGRGIGLPLTRALAEANGASLLIDSAPERGTQVTIAFGKDRVVPV